MEIRGAWIDGSLNLEYTDILFPLTLDRCVLADGLAGAGCSIRHLSITGSRAAHVDMDGGRVDHDLIITKTTCGHVRAVGATIGGTLVLSNAALSNPSGDALSLDGAEIRGDLFAGDGFTATGQVRATSVIIGGQLVLSGAALHNPSGVVLSLDRTEVRGDLFADDGFTTTGEVRALGATIGGALVLSGAALSNPDGDALSLQQAQIQGLYVRGITQCAGGLNLTACQVGDLAVNHEANGLPRLTAAAGWRVRDIHGHLRADRSAAIRWLDTTDRFTTSPWEELARVYDRNGQPADARRVRFAAAHRSTRHAPWYSKLFRWLYASTVGYGYYPLIAAVWLLAAILAATALAAANPGAFLPAAATTRIDKVPAGVTCPSVTEPLTAADDPRCRAPGYPTLHPLTYALATVSPASAVTQPAWAPLAAGAAWLETTLTALKLIGWLMTAMLLAGLTGLLRKG